MRIWDRIHPRKLCSKHLLGEHRELHAIWSILSKGKTGYRNHPEVKRWEGCLGALYFRHELLCYEFSCRGYNHASPLVPELKASPEMPLPWDDQERALVGKGCNCDIG